MNNPASSHSNPAQSRADFALIAKWIRPGAKVLDLGCGDGTLLTQLRNSHRIRGYGVEKDDQSWLRALENGVDVIQNNLEEGLSGFEALSFDTVILSQTLQAVLHTETIVQEMLRVGREAIVTFPNFGYWRHRMQLIAGQMPVSKSLPYAWYNTPNIHLCTIQDFDVFCAEQGIQVMQRLVMNANREIHLMPNLRGSLAMYRLCQKSA
jgi:methionine biosynthesis protein MetW